MSSRASEIEEDAAPFLLRCAVTRSEFRHLDDFQSKTLRGELNVYAWPTTTLREVANLLYLVDPTLSRPMTTHDFRVVYFDGDRGRYEADRPVYGVTRIPTAAVASLLASKEGSLDASQKASAAEQAASRTLQQLRVRDDTVLECALDAAPIPGRRERSPPRRGRRYRS
ncbi:Uncharacterized protein MSYG_1221 [Malassezia sympodialis ATCC 42132]|uniref:Uncharacterized protein n=1 Tax=Malassezia sympodialis (strain ATCC 42132) TaxID=1230383 RepID=A0A1M8A326_MALS4|nr:Uncharacterized protein MSYG_1221 [Malassezia sympodialis ATCC 42132]